MITAIGVNPSTGRLEKINPADALHAATEFDFTEMAKSLAALVRKKAEGAEFLARKHERALESVLYVLRMKEEELLEASNEYQFKGYDSLKLIAEAKREVAGEIIKEVTERVDIYLHDRQCQLPSVMEILLEQISDMEKILTSSESSDDKVTKALAVISTDLTERLGHLFSKNTQTT